MGIYEVFIKADGREEFRHAGALDAATDDLALVMARETYLRRAEGTRLWLVRREHLVVADADFVQPNLDKPHRHHCLLYTSPSPRDATLSRMPSSA